MKVLATIVLLLCAHGASTAPITYNVDFTLDDSVDYTTSHVLQPGLSAHVTGQIETHGTIGALGHQNIRSFWFNYVIGAYETYFETGDLSGLTPASTGANSATYELSAGVLAQVYLASVSATETAISLGPAPSGVFLGVEDTATFFNDCYFDMRRAYLSIGTGCHEGVASYAFEAGDFSQVADAASVPLPAGGLLLTAALAVLWRKKRS
jgi:hypothetical protein